jgi:hypothetical protein
MLRTNGFIATRSWLCEAPTEVAAPAPAAQPAAKDPPVADDPTPGREQFSREYVTELRQENKGWRLKSDEERKKRQDAETAAEQARNEAATAKTAADAGAEEKAKAAETRANERIVRAELRTLAIGAGMIDLDGLKLADLKDVTMDGDDVKGGAELIEKLKVDKPYLFGTPKGTSDTTKPPPAPGKDKPKTAREMNREEYEAAKKAASR